MISKFIRSRDLSVKTPPVKIVFTVIPNCPISFDKVFEKEEIVINSSLHLVDLILEKGKKGAQISRYKGLGEMNPDQLWETTLDPDARTLLQVKIDDAAEADDLFTRLMGEVVEPRREFIQQNALTVENLDF